MQHKIDMEFDLTGLDSPAPMLKTKEVIDNLLPGQTALVRTTAPGSEQNIRNLINNHPAKLLLFKKEDGVLHFVIEKDAVLAAQ